MGRLLWSMAPVLVACDGDPEEVSVRVYVPAADTLARRVEVAVVATCAEVADDLGADPEAPLQVVEALVASPEPLGLLPEGGYGLYARAWREDCILYAAGCDSFRIPDEDGIVDVALATIATHACGPGDSCVDDRCVPDADAPEPDAGAR